MRGDQPSRSGTAGPRNDASKPRRLPALPPRFRRNVATVYLNTFVTIATVAVTTPILIHGLGRSQYGIWVLLNAISPYAALLDLGVGAATMKYVAELHGRDDAGLARVTATSMSLLGLLGVFVLIVGLAFAIVFPDVFGIRPHDASSASVAMAIVVVDAAVALPAGTFSASLAAVQRYDILYLTLTGVGVAQAIGWVLVVVFGGGLVELAVVTVAFDAVGHVVRFVAVRRVVRGAAFTPRLYDREAAGRIARLSGWIALGNASTVIINRIDAIVVAAVAGVTAAGVYGVGQTVAVGVEQLVRPVFTGFFPRAAELSAEGDDVALRRTMFAGTRLAVAIAAPSLLAVVVLAKPAVRVWVGSGFGTSATVAMYLVAALAVGAVTRTGFLMLQAAGHVHVTSRIVAAEAVLNLVLSIVLGRALGAAGVALATLIAATAARAVMLPYVCRAFGVRVRDFAASVARANGIPLALSATVGWGLWQAKLSTVPTLVAAALALVTVYSLAFAAFGLTADERRRVVVAVARLRTRLSGSG